MGSGASKLLAEVTADELRELAAALLRRERPGHTLQATALVNEAWIRLGKRTELAQASHSEFLCIAAVAMRRILVDYARAHRAEKRGGNLRKVTLDTAYLISDSHGIDYVELDDCLDRLAQLSARQAKVVELRFFGGLTMDEVAEALGISKRTVEGDWTVARAWLLREMKG